MQENNENIGDKKVNNNNIVKQTHNKITQCNICGARITWFNKQDT